MKTMRSTGITVWGYLLVLGSLFQIAALLSGGYTHYAYLHQEYNAHAILIRYWVSWIIKISGLIAGFGILKLNDGCRKFAILNSVFTIATVYLKHTYAAYSLHTKYLDQTLGGNFPGISFSSLTWPALIIQRSIDIVFGVLLIYFLTRPEIRDQFKKKKTRNPSITDE